MILRRGLLACAVALLAVACAERPTPPPGAPWASPARRDHPLAGRIWRPGTGRFVTADDLVAALARADFVLLGEKHDNADHHRIQAWVLERLTAAGRRPAVAFEMLTGEQEEALTAYLDAHPGDASGLGAAVDWAETGWPDYEFYRPIVQAALDGGGAILAAGISRATLKRIFGEKASAEDRAWIAEHGLDRPLPQAAEESLRRQIAASHCDVLPEAMIGPAARANRARDAYMASVMTSGAALPGRDGVVLIAGFGHTRLDRGAPWHLARRAPGRPVVSLGILEVDGEGAAPADYAAGLGHESLPFDFVWFTPRVDEEDPCETFAKQLERMGTNRGDEPEK